MLFRQRQGTIIIQDRSNTQIHMLSCPDCNHYPMYTLGHLDSQPNHYKKLELLPLETQEIRKREQLQYFGIVWLQLFTYSEPLCLIYLLGTLFRRSHTNRELNLGVVYTKVLIISLIRSYPYNRTHVLHKINV